MDDRINRLEANVSALQVNGARMEAVLESLDTTVKELKVVVEELRDAASQGKGALWAFGLAAAGIGTVGGGLISFIVKKVFGG